MAAVMLLSSCGGAAGDTATTGEQTTVAPETEPETVIGFELSENNSSFTVIRPEEKSSSPSYGVTVGRLLFAYLKEAYPENADISEDFLKPGTTPDPDVYEIYVGSCARDESTELFEKLSGGSSFGIICRGRKVAIGGETAALTFKAAEYFIKTFAVKDEGGRFTVEVPDGYEYIGTGTSYYTVADMVESKREFTITKDSIAVKIKPLAGYTTVQGGGTDGTYAYVCLNSGGTPGNCRINKYDLSDWSLVASSDVVEAGHSNDLTYDPETGNLMIVTNVARDGWNGIALVDRDTLTLKEIITPVNHCALEYVPSLGQYVTEMWTPKEDGSHYLTNVFYDRGFNEIRRFNEGDSDNTCQGLYCDGSYIYNVRYIKSGDNYLDIETINGEHIGTPKLEGALGEAEHIFWYDGFFYVGCNKVSTVFRMSVIPTTLDID